MVLSVEDRYDFEKIMDGLMNQILMVGFSGILGAGQAEDQNMMKEKLIDGKEFSVDLEANQLK